MIEILNQQNRYWINRRVFKKLLRGLIDYYQLGNPEVTLAFVGNRVIRGLNRRFLNKDRPTDVLSFPLGEMGMDGKYYLGDIIISVPKAFEQCFRKTYGLQRELEYLTIHGFLHLQGYRHFQGLEEEEIKIRRLFLDSDQEQELEYRSENGQNYEH